MPSQDNLNVVRKLYDYYNKNDASHLNVFDEVLASNVQIHDSSLQGTKGDLQSHKQAEAGYIKAFPNKKTKIDSIFGSDDQVVVRCTTTATHKGQFQGISPTNKEIKITGISIYRVSNGKITEIWQNWDHLGLLEQIGEYHPAHAHR